MASGWLSGLGGRPVFDKIKHNKRTCVLKVTKTSKWWFFCHPNTILRLNLVPKLTSFFLIQFWHREQTREHDSMLLLITNYRFRPNLVQKLLLLRLWQNFGRINKKAWWPHQNVDSISSLNFQWKRIPSSGSAHWSGIKFYWSEKELQLGKLFTKNLKIRNQIKDCKYFISKQMSGRSEDTL